MACTTIFRCLTLSPEAVGCLFFSQRSIRMVLRKDRELVSMADRTAATSKAHHQQPAKTIRGLIWATQWWWKVKWDKWFQKDKVDEYGQPATTNDWFTLWCYGGQTEPRSSLQVPIVPGQCSPASSSPIDFIVFLSLHPLPKKDQGEEIKAKVGTCRGVLVLRQLLCKIFPENGRWPNDFFFHLVSPSGAF